MLVQHDYTHTRAHTDTQTHKNTHTCPETRNLMNWKTMSSHSSSFSSTTTQTLIGSENKQRITVIPRHKYPKSGNFRCKKNLVDHFQRQKLHRQNFFFQRINGVSLYCRVVIATKVKPVKNLTNVIFYHWKIPDLGYMQDKYRQVHVCMHVISSCVCSFMCDYTL